VDAVTALIHRRVVPAAVELIDADTLDAMHAYTGRSIAPPGTGALLIVETDGTPASAAEELTVVEAACRDCGATEIITASTDSEREDIWAVRREGSLALRATGLLKINHDVVVPRGRVPELFDIVERLKRDYQMRIASFGHAGDGNIHVNLMVNPNDAAEMARSREAERVLFEGVVALEGSISGEHGIGFAKQPYIALELSSAEIALMKRVKTAFDPAGILNPGKIFP
jgi:FAD/FMN-containing dehydrogenase